MTTHFFILKRRGAISWFAVQCFVAVDVNMSAGQAARYVIDDACRMLAARPRDLEIVERTRRK